ncbi:MAG TPA: permease-like cell division protein FtsX [Deltaproteobacteria bacterium]|nr:permease-like cell division protein FtsX [Deltaproteobacteria bacterium]
MIRLFYILKLLGRGFSRRPWGGFITLVACWFAVCQLIMVFHAVSFTGRAKTVRGTTSTIMAYLAGRPDEVAIGSVRERIAAMSEVASVEFVPRGSGLVRLKQWLGPEDSLVKDIDPDILPDAFEIGLKPEHTGSIEDVAARIGTISEVEDVRYDRGILGSIAEAYYMVLISGMVLALIVVLSLSLVVFLSIRVGMISRRREMEVLHLLGAGRFFLCAPYFMEAFVYGVGGAVLALLAMEGALAFLVAEAPVLGSLLPPLHTHQMIFVVALPGFLSLLAAHLAIKRSIDE